MDYDKFKFFSSPYFVPEPNNWHLKDGAPQEIVDEFNEFVKADKESKEEGLYE